MRERGQLTPRPSGAPRRLAPPPRSPRPHPHVRLCRTTTQRTRGPAAGPHGRSSPAATPPSTAETRCQAVRLALGLESISGKTPSGGVTTRSLINQRPPSAAAEAGNVRCAGARRVATLRPCAAAAERSHDHNRASSRRNCSIQRSSADTPRQRAANQAARLQGRLGAAPRQECLWRSTTPSEPPLPGSPSTHGPSILSSTHPTRTTDTTRRCRSRLENHGAVLKPWRTHVVCDRA